MPVEQIALLAVVEEWPTRKLPQDRYDAVVKKSMKQMSAMVGGLNGDFIPKVNAINIRVQENADKSAQSETNARASEVAARASENAAKASETSARDLAGAAKTSADAAKTSETNAKASEQAAIRAQNNAVRSEANALAHANAAKSVADQVRNFQSTALEDYNRVKAETEKAIAAAEKARDWADETRAGAEAAKKVMESVTAAQLLLEEALEARDESFENRCQAAGKALCAKMSADVARVCLKAVRAEREAQVDVRYMEALAGFQEQLARLSDRVTELHVEA